MHVRQLSVPKSSLVTKLRGFAAMSPERRREIAAKGGRAAQKVHKFNKKQVPLPGVLKPATPEPDLLDALIGKTEAQAVDMVHRFGATTRVVERDGVHPMVTRDYRTDRANLYLANGRVIQVVVG